MICEIYIHTTTIYHSKDANEFSFYAITRYEANKTQNFPLKISYKRMKNKKKVELISCGSSDES